jgi:hypothetical protein
MKMATTEAPSPEELLHAVEQLDTPQMQAFAQRVLTLRARRMAPAHAGRDAELVSLVGATLPEATMARYRDLKAAGDAGRLNAAERDELIALSDVLEEWNARRWSHLAELAEVRGITLREAASQLGLLRNDDDA